MARSDALDFSPLLRPSTVPASTSGPAATAVGGVRTPDEQATVYFREHSGAVFRYLAGIYGREEDAEEVTQEAFLRLHQALVEGGVIESPRAWTLTVARRLMLDRIRHDHAASTRIVAVGADVLDAVRDSAPSPEDSLAERRRLDAVNHAFRDLNDLERQCLAARAEGYTLREIGQIVNLDLRRVAEIVTRSVRTLQGRLRA